MDIHTLGTKEVPVTGSVRRRARAVTWVLSILFLVAIAHGRQTPTTIHVFVALCDNVHQGIIPVPAHLGNGEDLAGNLYWGAAYGVRTFFSRSADWRLLRTHTTPAGPVLQRCVFRHRRRDVYLVADAYKGSEIRQAISDFVQSANGTRRERIAVSEGTRELHLDIASSSRLVAYVGHNGLMEFSLDDPTERSRRPEGKRDAIILACASKSYFFNVLNRGSVRPLVWTTGLMSPEAYTLHAAIDGWIVNESAEAIRERAARAYHRYQKCGLRAAKRLLVSGW